MNPVAKLCGVLILAIPVVISIDLVTAGVVALAAVVYGLIRVPLRQLLLRCIPLFIAAPMSGLSMLLYARPGGREYFHFLAATVSDNSIGLALAIGLRVFALALPVMVMFYGVDATELGDALGQVWKLPHRFVIGAISAVRIVALAGEDWASIMRARRARGIGGLRAQLTGAFGLFVALLRRGDRLATAMEARAFGPTPRTWARPSRLGRIDALFLLGCAALAALAIWVSVATGAWRVLGL